MHSIGKGALALLAATAVLVPASGYAQDKPAVKIGAVLSMATSMKRGSIACRRLRRTRPR